MMALSLTRRSLASGLRSCLVVRQSSNAPMSQAAREMYQSKIPVHQSSYDHSKVSHKTDCAGFREMAQVEIEFVRHHGLHEVTPYRDMQIAFWITMAVCSSVAVWWYVVFLKEMRTCGITEWHKGLLNAKRNGEI